MVIEGKIFHTSILNFKRALLPLFMFVVNFPHINFLQTRDSSHLQTPQQGNSWLATEAIKTGEKSNYANLVGDF